MTYPQRSVTVHVEQLGAELCIYDWQRKEVHALNPTAARVWQLCDGQTSPAQIAQILQAELNVPNAEELVWFSLSQMEKAHLLAEPVVKPARRKVLPRREFLRLGIAAAILPVIHSIMAPTPVAAQSPVPTTTPTATAPAATATATAIGAPTTTATATATATPTATLVPPGSQTFNFTGAAQQFTVPAGVTSVTIQAFGAQGGSVPSNPGTGIGGKGGSVVATIAVTSGEVLQINVGGQGQDNQGGGTAAPSGGFNGGGLGGTGFNANAGGGGGASDIRQGGVSLANRVVVAGGGGGGGVNNSINRSAGGGTTGEPGSNGESNLNIQIGGGGGTQSVGGAAGRNSDLTTTATPGTFGVGGIGGAVAGGFRGGGGGGGGYYGGGGGGGSIATDFSVSAGGGGGSSFAIPTATNVTHQQGVRTGDGQVIISWP